MVIVHFKWVLFVVLLLLLIAIWLTWVIARRRPSFDEQQVAVWRAFPLGVVLLSPSHHIQFANRAAYTLFQAAEERAATAVFRPLLEKIEPHTAVQHFSLSISPELTLDVWSGPWGTSRLILLLDVSEQRRRELDLSHFWGSVSHELRTPLTSILSHVEVARSPNAPPEVQQHSLAIVNQQALRLTNLVHNALELGRLKAGRYATTGKVDLILVAEEAIGELILLAEAQNVAFNFHCETAFACVAGDPDKLKQLFINLLDNALKYCRPGDSVTVSLSSGGGEVYGRISDTGPGIAAEQLPRVTEQFYRGRRDVAGSGLGLAIVAEIVRQHHGRFWVESNSEGEVTGTAVTFTLPRLEE
jgi:two-component system, OmpR family, phosphate regulon sensor histidine kinase PhoR